MLPPIDFLIKNGILCYMFHIMNTKIRVNSNKNIKHNTIKAKLGLTDKTNHSVFYLEGGTFITPKIELDDFTNTMNIVEKMCRKAIKSKLMSNDFLENTFLMNFEICADRMKKDKNSYLSFQYHFKQKDNANHSIVTIKKNHEQFFIDLLNELNQNLNAFQMIAHKKRNEV